MVESDKGDASTPPTADAGTPPDEKVLTRITEAITPVDLGQDVNGEAIPWDAEGVAAVAPVFAKHGVTPEAAKAIVGAYAEHFKAQVAAGRKAETDLNAQMVAECRTTFGADLPKHFATARKGGEDIFGRELFGQLAAVPFFVNDHRIISALAARGRAITNDSSPGGAGLLPDERDLAARMYGPEIK